MKSLSLTGLLLATLAGSTAVALPLVDQTGNLLSNGNFESGSTTPTSSGSGVSTFSSLTGWNQYSNTGPVTSTWAGAPVVEGDHSARITGNTNDGLYQYNGGYTGTYTLSAWVYALSGSAHLVLAWNSGSTTAIGSSSTLTGQWEYLSVTATMNGSLGGPVLYGASNNADFYIDGVWINAGSTSSSPMDPGTGFNPNAVSTDVPEPASAALLLGGLGLLARRRTRR